MRPVGPQITLQQAVDHLKSLGVDVPELTPSPRRLENRVATLETRLGEMADTLGEVIGFNAELTERIDALTTPDQPAAPRIDPDDEALWEVVHPFLCDPATGLVMPSFLNGRGKAMLIAIAKHVNGPDNA